MLAKCTDYTVKNLYWTFYLHILKWSPKLYNIVCPSFWWVGLIIFSHSWLFQLNANECNSISACYMASSTPKKMSVLAVKFNLFSFTILFPVLMINIDMPTPRGGTLGSKWQGCVKDFFGVEIFNSGIFLGRGIWQVFFWVTWFK